MSESNQQRVGLFGGTFDPVHFGHLRPALELAETYQLNTLHLLPNHRPAHRDAPTASTGQRIDMLNLAVENVPLLQVDAREALRDKASYTYDTLVEYTNDYPNASLVFFMGMDAFSQFESWYRWQDILTLANLVIVDRPNAKLSDWALQLIEQQTRVAGKHIGEARAGVIERCSVTQLAISATNIRKHCHANQQIDFLVPERVKQYIVQQGLYKR